MFPYMGSKAMLARYYPCPKYDLIIEPFAGSARYSCTYSNRHIWLNDLYDKVYKAWKYILGSTREQIKNLPELKHGESVYDYNLTEEERIVIGFCIHMNTHSPGIRCSEWAERYRYTRNMKKNILRQHMHFRNWKITNKDYRELENIEATWFIDPPYIKEGKAYVNNGDNINYRELAEWCKSRKGQVIVCESAKADWLPFEPLRKTVSRRNTGFKREIIIEGIWTNYERRIYK